MIACLIPPPVWPKVTGVSVKNAHDSAPAPRFTTEPTTSASTPTASRAAPVPSTSMRRPTSFRRRRAAGGSEG